MSRALVLADGEGHDLEARGSRMSFKAVAASTGGAFSLMDRRLPAGGRRPPRHRHPDATEAFYVLDGTLTFWLDDDTIDCGAGGFVLAPGGVAHSFANRTEREARLLILHAPAKDAYFQDLHELWSSDTPPSTAAELDLMRRHGMEPVA